MQFVHICCSQETVLCSASVLIHVAYIGLLCICSSSRGQLALLCCLHACPVPLRIACAKASEHVFRIYIWLSCVDVAFARALLESQWPQGLLQQPCKAMTCFCTLVMAAETNIFLQGTGQQTVQSIITSRTHFIRVCCSESSTKRSAQLLCVS